MMKLPPLVFQFEKTKECHLAHCNDTCLFRLMSLYVGVANYGGVRVSNQ